MVVPSSFSWVSSCITSSPLAVSRLPVGSSARISLGRATTARAMATRCCWPPESCEGMWRARWPIFMRSSACRGALVGARRLIHLRDKAAPARHFPATFSSSIRLKLWKTKPMAFLRRLVSRPSEWPAIFWPSNQYSPDVGLSSMPTMLRKVDLPQPEGPIIATNSPVRDLQVHVAHRRGLHLGRCDRPWPGA